MNSETLISGILTAIFVPLIAVVVWQLKESNRRAVESSQKFQSHLAAQVEMAEKTNDANIAVLRTIATNVELQTKSLNETRQDIATIAEKFTPCKYPGRASKSKTKKTV